MTFHLKAFIEMVVTGNGKIFQTARAAWFKSMTTTSAENFRGTTLDSASINYAQKDGIGNLQD